MKLSHVTIGQLTTGHVINLASNDVQRFDQVRLIINGLITFQVNVTYFSSLQGIYIYPPTVDQSPGVCSVHIPPLHQCGVHWLHSHGGGHLGSPIASEPDPALFQNEVRF